MTRTYQHVFYYFEKIKVLQYTFEKLLYENYIFYENFTHSQKVWNMPHFYQASLEIFNFLKLWKILKEMEIPDRLTCLLRNLYAGQEAKFKTTWDNRLVPDRKRSISRLYIVTLLINLYAEYIMRNAGLEEAQLESRLLGEISITSDIQMTPPLWQKVKRN